MADSNAETLRISVDTKATINIGEYSRNGSSRGAVAVQALDHDMCTKEKLIPGGILEVVTGNSFLFFGTNFKTSDFMVDGLLLWWQERKAELSGIKNLVINLDNGPECNGHRSQFLLRMTEFVDTTGLSVRLVYYPPYHSKYNGVERYWAGLEKSWNGYLLRDVETVLNRARNFFWKKNRTVAHLMDGQYKKGVKVCGDEKTKVEQRLHRSEFLKWWDITIYPKMVC